MRHFVGYRWIACFLLCFLMLMSAHAAAAENADGKRFKEEYEALNGTYRENTQSVYNPVQISEENPVRYCTAQEAIEKIRTSGTVVYFGANWCPWCRNSITPMLEAAKLSGVETIWYVDMTQERDVYALEDGEVVLRESGTTAYQTLLEALDPLLKAYVLKDSDGNEFTLDEKRITIPYLAAVSREGVQYGLAATLTLPEGQSKYDIYTEEQQDLLKQEIMKLFEILA